jgi:hypothetical protein
MVCKEVGCTFIFDNFCVVCCVLESSSALFVARPFFAREEQRQQSVLYDVGGGVEREARSFSSVFSILRT